MKIKIFLVIIFIVLIFASIFYKNANNKNEENEKEINNVNEIIEYKIDDETGEYIIYNKNHEEVGKSFDEYRLQMYLDDPDYNPNPSY